MHIVNTNGIYHNVLGLLFQEVDETNPLLSPITDALYLIANQSIDSANFNLNLMKLMPSDLTSYFRYSGSLTTPPCSQTVTWSVFYQPIHISSQQVN